MSFQYLTLECVGTIDEYGGNEVWAATFDYTLDDSEWFEKYRVSEYPTAARGSTPEEALFGAVEKFNKLTGRVKSQ